MYRFDQLASFALAAVGALFLSSLTVAAAVAPGHQAQSTERFTLASTEAIANG